MRALASAFTAALIAATAVAQNTAQEAMHSVARIDDTTVIVDRSLPPPEIDLLRSGLHAWSKLLLEVGKDPVAGDAVELVDRADRTVLLIRLTKRDVWTPPLTVPIVRLKLRGSADRVVVRAVARGLTSVSVQTTVGEPNLNPAWEAGPAIRTGGIVLLEYALADRVKRCNAIVLAPRVIMTNEHCIGSAAVVADRYYPRVYPSFVSDDAPGDEIRISRFLDADIGADASLLELAMDVPDAANRVVALASKDPASSHSSPLALRVVQYYEPYGWSKVVSNDSDCRLISIPVAGVAAGTDFLHGCDTEKGTSGAAVFSVDGLVVGLHHWGRDEQGRWADNKAVRIERVWQFINRARGMYPALQLPSL